ncbi:MAG: hypothetical protein OXH09_18235 [Gammaproteobacteria bacterium]|nr:hypothetical protein [Gammaproteobacteria bacterium]
MLYTYAIEPDVLVTWDKCRNTLNLMGFQHGRAIAGYPSRKRWMALVRAACRRCGTPEHDRKRIFLKLQRSNAKLVASEAQYDDSIQPDAERWIRNAVGQQAAIRAFQAILATRNPGGHPDVILEEDVDESHGKLAVPRDSDVLREPRALAEHLATLIRNSSELLLIDPHFDPSKDRWRPIVGACIELAGRGRRDNPNVTIHTQGRATPSLHDFRALCRRYIPAMMSGRVTSVRVCRWRKRDTGSDDVHDIHARYVLTDRGGYSLDKGLDQEPGVLQPVRLLDEPAWKRVREGYGDGEPFFDKEGEFEITRPPALKGKPS